MSGRVKAAWTGQHVSQELAALYRTLYRGRGSAGVSCAHRSAGPAVRFERRRMEWMGSSGISAYAGLWQYARQCEGDLPFLSQADASAFSTLRIAYQY